jgi:hypothetical protein
MLVMYLQVLIFETKGLHENGLLLHAMFGESVLGLPDDIFSNQKSHFV